MLNKSFRNEVLMRLRPVFITKFTAGAGGDPGGDGDDPTKGGAGGNNKVDYETHKRLLNQHGKLKDDMKAMKSQLDELLAAKTADDEKSKTEQGNFKALFEDRDTKVKELTASIQDLTKKVDEYENKFTDARKINALKEKIGGRLKQTEYHTFIDTSKIALTEDGEIDKSSLETYANSFVNKFKDLIEFNKGGKFPDGAGGRGDGRSTLTREQWLKLPLKEQRERMGELRNNEKNNK